MLCDSLWRYVKDKILIPTLSTNILELRQCKTVALQKIQSGPHLESFGENFIMEFTSAKGAEGNYWAFIQNGSNLNTNMLLVAMLNSFALDI